MNEDFITKAIENDRYLKAIRLADQFEEEIDRKLENFLEETIEQRPDLFVDDTSPSKRKSRVRTEPLAHRRVQATMDRVNSDGDNLKFYISIEWTQPEVHGRDGDGALCLILYKIKNSARAEYDRVKQETQAAPEWDEIQCSDDAWNSDRGIFYLPVTDGGDVMEALQLLREHFFSFAEDYGLPVTSN